jgi:hypothetical protein
MLPRLPVTVCPDPNLDVVQGYRRRNLVELCRVLAFSDLKLLEKSD